MLKKPLLTFSEFINKSIAKLFAIQNSGVIMVGMKAGINVIELNLYKPHADFSKWDMLSTGVAHQFVNESLSISDGELTHQNRGQVILKSL